MQVKKNKDTTRLISAALKKTPCDLVIINIKLINVLTGEIYSAFVEILDGIIVYVGTDGDEHNDSRDIYDGGGGYLLPGFMDIHMHVESSMMLPENFGIQAVVAGTTSIFADPHEIGNVLGEKGIRFMVQHAQGSPVRQFNLAPSCIPADCEFQSSFHEIQEKEMDEMLSMNGVYGIAEVMDYMAVVNDTSRMHGILKQGLDRELMIQGHAPGLGGRELSAYRLGGPQNNHTARSQKEVLDNLRAGLHVNFQSSSLVNSSLPEALKGIKGHRWTDLVSVCTDDVHAQDLFRHGHINAVVKQLISYEIDPMTAIKWATINTAREAGIEDLGAIAPGYVADIQIVAEMDGQMPKAVFVDGKMMAEDGTYIGGDTEYIEVEDSFCNTIQISEHLLERAFDTVMDEPEKNIPIVECQGKKRSQFTLRKETFVSKEGKLSLDDKADMCFVCVLNRHGEHKISKAIYHGLGLKRGAMATSVSHDSHNLVIAYKKAEDAMAAVRWMKESGGGFCSVIDGTVTGEIRLPVAGLMSLLPCDKLVAVIDSFQKGLKDIFVEKEPEILKLSLLCLTVLPGIAITEDGLVDGSKRKMIGNVM